MFQQQWLAEGCVGVQSVVGTKVRRLCLGLRGCSRREDFGSASKEDAIRPLRWVKGSGREELCTTVKSGILC